MRDKYSEMYEKIAGDEGIDNVYFHLDKAKDILSKGTKSIRKDMKKFNKKLMKLASDALKHVEKADQGSNSKSYSLDVLLDELASILIDIKNGRIAGNDPIDILKTIEDDVLSEL